MYPAETPNAMEKAVIISKLGLKIALKIKRIINRVEKHIKNFIITFPLSDKEIPLFFTYFKAKKLLIPIFLAIFSGTISAAPQRMKMVWKC